MHIKEKKAIARIFADLIKADRIVDTGEMECWEKICEKYNIDKDIKVQARDMSFAEALNVITESNTESLKEELLEDCRSMTVSDGFCAHSEALLMIALFTMLDTHQPYTGEVFSIPRVNFDIDIATALYIENEYDDTVNEDIRKKYRLIFKEFQLAGFHFVYIPNIINHYRSTPSTLFKSILSFLAPTMSEEGLDTTYDSLMQMSTGVFCKDLLCNKCGISELRTTCPALLIKIGNSFVGETRFANYLKINIHGDILETVQKFVDRFTDMLSSDVFVVNTSEERDNQFHFHGFYKQLLDIFLIKKNIRSTILLNPYREEIRFPDIDEKLSGINRREKALYVLLLCYGTRGLNFKKPRNAKEMAEYTKRMDEIQSRYKIIYEIFGGEKENAPDITIPDIRRPIFSRLKTALTRLSGLYNPKDYYFHKGNDGCYTVHIDTILINVVNRDSKIIPLKDSRLYRRWEETEEGGV